MEDEFDAVLHSAMMGTGSTGKPSKEPAASRCV
jgi:hypothetical protein